MTDPVEAIVACPECCARARNPAYLVRRDHQLPTVLHEQMGRVLGGGHGGAVPVTNLDDIQKTSIVCPTCNGTGLVRIRALREDVPTIDRTPEGRDKAEAYKIPPELNMGKRWEKK